MATAHGDPPAVIAVIPALFPIPPEAGTPRPFHLLRGLAARARVALVGVVPATADEWRRFVASPQLDGTFETSRHFLQAPTRSLAARVRTTLAGRPAFDVGYCAAEQLAEVHAEVERLLGLLGGGVFYCWTLRALQWVPEPLWRSCALDFVDAPLLSVQRQIRGDPQLSLRGRLGLRLSLLGLRRYERRALGGVGAAVYNSSADIATVARRFPGAPIRRVIDGADVDYFSPEHVDVEEGDNEIAFVGNMLYPPNADAARFLATEIMPLVWRQRPDARALLLGPDPLGRLRGLHDGRRIVVTGFVEDVRPYLARAAVVVSPLRFGAGMKNKLQAGLGLEKAMVISGITLEGFDDLEPGRHALLADSAADFASAILALLRDPERRRTLGKAGARLIRTAYSWGAAVDALWDALRSCPTAHAAGEPGSPPAEGPG